MNVDDTKDEENEYRGPPITFQILAQPVQSKPYVSAAMLQPFPNNVALQYAHSGEPHAPNVQPGDSLVKRAPRLPKF